MLACTTKWSITGENKLANRIASIIPSGNAGFTTRISTTKTIIVALVLCIVCSLVVSSAAVLLKDQQDANKKLDRYSNILAAAGMLNKDESIEDQYNRLITARVVDLETGRYTDVVDVATYDQRRAVKDNFL